MGEKDKVARECDKLNRTQRKVQVGRGVLSDVPSDISGHLLVTGHENMTSDLLYEYGRRVDMSTIVLTSDSHLLEEIRYGREHGYTGMVGMVSDPAERNYHPMYGMTTQQVITLLSAAAEEMGCKTMMDQVLLYTAAAIDLVFTEYPVSLPALSALLAEDDVFLSDLAEQKGMSNITRDSILGSCEAGIMLRRTVAKMEDVLKDVSRPDSETKYSFQSGALGHVPIMAFYQSSSSQKLMNLYLAEELYGTVRRTDRLRVIADNIQFTGESDPLLTCLMQLKREGKIELVVTAPNIREMIPAGVPLDFPNIIFTDHYNDKTTEDISRELFGTYQYHYPACTAGRPAAMLFTLKKDIHWNIGSEEWLRIKPGDLYIAEMLFGGIMVREDETDLSWRYGSKEEYGAVKFAGDNCIYLLPINQPCRADT